MSRVGEDSVAECLAGRISPEVALARLLLGGAGGADAIGHLLAERRPEPYPEPPRARWSAMAALAAERGPALDALAAEIAATASDHTAIGATPAGVAAFFDRAAAHSPEAGVALFSLGDPVILAAATGEVVAWLREQGLLRPGADVLDLGCGFGRVAAALAPGCRSVLGLDVSAGMIAEARRRHAGIANARFETTPGVGLTMLPPAGFDLVLAVDSFPYIVQAGLAPAHLAGAALALRPGGALAVLNLSYGRGIEADRADATAWAAASGFALEVGGARPFTLWDGTVWVFKR